MVYDAQGWKGVWPEVFDRTTHAYAGIVDKDVDTAIDCECGFGLVLELG
jgi:hypothetical protein